MKLSRRSATSEKKEGEGKGRRGKKSKWSRGKKFVIFERGRERRKEKKRKKKIGGEGAREDNGGEKTGVFPRAISTEKGVGTIPDPSSDVVSTLA